MLPPIIVIISVGMVIFIWWMFSRNCKNSLHSLNCLAQNPRKSFFFRKTRRRREARKMMDELMPELVALVLTHVDRVSLVASRFVCATWKRAAGSLPHHQEEEDDYSQQVAANGRLALLQWAHANGCPWDQWVCARAALGGHLAVLQWARANGCPWDKWTCAASPKKISSPKGQGAAPLLHHTCQTQPHIFIGDCARVAHVAAFLPLVQFVRWLHPRRWLARPVWLVEAPGGRNWLVCLAEPEVSLDFLGVPRSTGFAAPVCTEFFLTLTDSRHSSSS
jgi:hypothetical protein